MIFCFSIFRRLVKLSFSILLIWNWQISFRWFPKLFYIIEEYWMIVDLLILMIFFNMLLYLRLKIWSMIRLFLHSLRFLIVTTDKISTLLIKFGRQRQDLEQWSAAKVGLDDWGLILFHNLFIINPLSGFKDRQIYKNSC